jgi:hypothetical protein
MSKSSKKLALRRESLRNLSPAELGQVGGGTFVMNNTIEWVILKQPAPSTSRTDSGFYFNLNYLYW